MSVTAARTFPWLPLLLGVVLIAVGALLLHHGWSFYRLPLEDRVEHPDFRKLRPSGLYGNGYGWIAALLVVLNLAYLVRRRIASSRLGSMRVWLDAHVFTGLFAAMLATFHSAFQLRTPMTMISAVSLGIVVATGLVGRFLYALAPAAHRFRLAAALESTETAFPGQRDAVEAAIVGLPGPSVPPNASLVRSLLAVPAWRRVATARRGAIALLLPARREMSSTQRGVARELARSASDEAGSATLTALLRSWRGLHRFFALLMLASVLLHAGVAWHYGYRWIFG